MFKENESSGSTDRIKNMIKYEYPPLSVYISILVVIVPN